LLTHPPYPIAQLFPLPFQSHTTLLPGSRILRRESTERPRTLGSESIIRQDARERRRGWEGEEGVRRGGRRERLRGPVVVVVVVVVVGERGEGGKEGREELCSESTRRQYSRPIWLPH